MDYNFPFQLFPNYYRDGPPELRWKHDYGGWGTYQQLLETSGTDAQCGAGRQTAFKFQPQHKVEGEVWIPTEPIVTPFLPPSEDAKSFSHPTVRPRDFPVQMQYFYVHHCMDSFSVMGELLREHFNFDKQSRRGKVPMGKLKDFISNLNYKKCELGTYSKRVNRYHHLLADITPDIPPTLLGQLLYEELKYQRTLKHFQPAAAGGLLGYFPMLNPKEFCLVYPTLTALDAISFHHVVLEFNEDKLPTLRTVTQPLVWSLHSTVRQVSVARVNEEAYTGLRSDYYCAAWKMKDGNRPHPIAVVKLKDRSTCINVSPHLSGEYAVASENGSAYLWTVETGMQKIRQENTNLYFNASSLWRWCDFTGHPRVMVYADQTGADLTDMRNSNCTHTLFKIGKSANCKSGERVVLSKYLGENHAYHHLITTQYSAYILDERMPCVPALKWEHMMESAPCFAQVVSPLGQSSTTKILLGANITQDTIMLQYSGGRLWPCQAHGPVQKLYSPCEGPQLVQLPRIQHKTEKRLAVPTAGLAAVQTDGYLCVLQFTEVGDIFYQTLRHITPTSCDSDPGLSTSSAPQQPVFMDKTSKLDREQHQHQEAVVDQPNSANGDESISQESSIVSGSSSHSAQNNCACPQQSANPEMISRKLKQLWQKWLEAVTKTIAKRKLRHRQIETSRVIRLKSSRGDKLEEDKYLHLRKDLTKISKTRKLLVHGETYLPPLEVTQVPDIVKPANWTDDLSQRLNTTWGDGWKEWWVEKLGMNKHAKISALRRKRLQEKRARARSRISLSGSFSSSVSYRDSLSEWSSAASQYLGSDSECQVSSQSAAKDNVLSDQDMLAESPLLHKESLNTKFCSVQTEPLKPVLKSHRKKTQLSDQDQDTRSLLSIQQQLPGQTCSLETDTALTSTPLPPSQPKVNRRQQKDYLSSLFGSQEPSQGFEEDSIPAAPISQPSKFSFLSQESSKFRTSSQASQPQKKKSRMGF